MRKNNVNADVKAADTIVVKVDDFAPYIDSDDKYAEIELKTYLSLLKIKALEEYKVTPFSDCTANVKIRVKDFFPDCKEAPEYNYVSIGIYDELLRMRTYTAPEAVKDGMIRIRVQDFYPDHTGSEEYTEVSSELYEYLVNDRRRMKSIEMKDYRYLAGCAFDEVMMGEINGIYEESAENNVIADEEIQSLYSALRKLPASQQRRVYLSYIAGMSREEIAFMDGVSTKAVGHSIRSGIKHLRRIMKR